MKHRDEQAMLLYFLDRDYSKSWEEIELEVGYAFGDFHFITLKPEEIMPLVRMMWASLHNKKPIRSRNNNGN